MGQKPKREIVCFCNDIDRKTIESAITSGADTLNKIFDCTTAGIGSCGGSCRVKLSQLLDGYKQSGTFPEKLIGKSKGKKTGP